MKKTNTFFSVYPRYTSGSPALVNETVAIHVAQQELSSYKFVLSGRYGEEKKSLAELYGLRGIVLSLTEKSSGKKSKWEVFDFLVERKYLVCSTSELRNQGWSRYENLEDYERVKIEKDPPVNKGDFRKYGWFKPLGFKQIIFYEPEEIEI